MKILISRNSILKEQSTTIILGKNSERLIIVRKFIIIFDNTRKLTDIKSSKDLTCDRLSCMHYMIVKMFHWLTVFALVFLLSNFFTKFCLPLNALNPSNFIVVQHY